MEKDIVLTGEAAEFLNKSGGNRRRRSRKTPQLSQTTPTVHKESQEMPVTIKLLSAPATHVPAPTPAPTPAAPVAQTQVQSKPNSTTLVLSPPKKKETKLILKAPTHTLKRKQTAATKVPRKIFLATKNLTVKINRAKKLHLQANTMKIEDVRQQLQERGLLRSGKKDMPEKMLREMYSDVLLLTESSL